jgi:HSP20 family protein
MIYRTSFGTPFWRVRSPFEEMDRLRRQMDNLLQTFSEGSNAPAGAGVFPMLNLTETKSSYLIRAELPGVKSDELDLKVTEKTITISGERKIPLESGDARYHRREREAGKFSRALAMPGDIDADRVEANLTNGILTVLIPKGEKAKPKQITIK